MQAAEKIKSPEIGERRTITLSKPHKDGDGKKRRVSQPCWPSNGTKTSVSHLMGRHVMTHEEATAIYMDALKREKAAREIREFYGEVVANWEEHTVPTEEGFEGQ